MRSLGFTNRAVMLSAISASLMCGAGCSGFSHGNSNPTPTTYVYIAEGGNTAIGQFQIGSDGTLIPLSPAIVSDTAGNGPAFLAIDPSGQFLFASGDVSPHVVGQFVIGSDGAITPNATPVVSGGDGFYSFAFTPNGQFAVIPNGAANTVNTYSLDAAGSLTYVGTQATCFAPIAAAVDPSGHYVYVGCDESGDSSPIEEYSISSSGVLTPLAPNNVEVAGSEVYHLTVSPKGFLYAANYGSGTVTAFAINESTGALANAGSFPSGVGAGSEPDWIAFDPTGAYAYVTNNTDYSVSQFNVNATTGALTMSAPDVPTDQWPAQIAVDPSGKFAYTVNSGDGTVSLFTISSSGTLTPNGILPLQTQFGRMAIAMVQR
jgi:6-phosphogluconolactonase (cycloisomerase 2 family)